MNDNEILLTALKKEREELHQKIMQLDRLIKKVREGNYLTKEGKETSGIMVTDITPNKSTIPLNDFPKHADIKVQLLRVFDQLGKACKLKEVQNAYAKLSGNHFNIREILRSMHRTKLIRLIREKDASRGFLWAKAEWIENEQLIDEYKPEGFDMLYKPENLEYE